MAISQENAKCKSSASWNQKVQANLAWLTREVLESWKDLAAQFLVIHSSSKQHRQANHYSVHCMIPKVCFMDVLTNLCEVTCLQAVRTCPVCRTTCFFITPSGGKHLHFLLGTVFVSHPWSRPYIFGEAACSCKGFAVGEISLITLLS